MEHDVLVAYASRLGTTQEVAEAIAKELSAGGASAVVLPVEEAAEPSRYRAVVLGGPLRDMAWLPEAVEWMRTHREELTTMPVAFFALGLTMSTDTPEQRRRMEEALAPARELVEPVAVGLFGGAVDPREVAFMLRDAPGPPQSVRTDFRDWHAIRAWARSLREPLGLTGPGPGAP